MNKPSTARTFSPAEIYPHAVAALGSTPEQYSLASLRYDLSKLRVKGLVEKLPRSRRYQLLAGIFRLPDLLEALRARLCSLDGRSPAPGPR